jgi:hypothetical protein
MEDQASRTPCPRRNSYEHVEVTPVDPASEQYKGGVPTSNVHDVKLPSRSTKSFQAKLVVQFPAAAANRARRVPHRRRGLHSSTRAAMIYQHASRDRDDAIATALNLLIVEARAKVAE